MAATSKKGGSCESAMGRPLAALSTFPKDIVARVKQLREGHPGWGAASVLDELGSEYPLGTVLPSIDSINRYLKREGLVTKYEPGGVFPKQRCEEPKAAHDLWELDAQGAVLVSGVGCQSMINMKDSHTKIHCMGFPVSVRHQMCQASKEHYKWALRLAFEESGLPLGIQVDKDSVFYENTTKSPYPTPLHLWLVALGVSMCHIKLPPPQKQAMVERSHQTLDRQVLMGQHYENWGQLFKYCNERRQRLNHKLPNRSLGNKAPCQVIPQAVHSGRPFSIEQEYDQLDPRRIHELLANGTWYRKVSSGKMVSIGGKRYYLKQASPKSQVQITFEPTQHQFIFRNVKELIVGQADPKGISKEELMDATTQKLIEKKAKIKKSKNFPFQN